MPVPYKKISDNWCHCETFLAGAYDDGDAWNGD